MKYTVTFKTQTGLSCLTYKHTLPITATSVNSLCYNRKQHMDRTVSDSYLQKQPPLTGSDFNNTL